MLRNTDLIVQRLHAEEEAHIRKQLDKKHMKEQVEFRQALSTSQAKIRREEITEVVVVMGKHFTKWMTKIMVIKI